VRYKYTKENINLIEKITIIKKWTMAHDLINTFLLRIICVLIIICVIIQFFNKECKKGYLYFLYDGSQQSYYLQLLIKDLTLENIYNIVIIDNIIRRLVSFFSFSDEAYFRMVNITDYVVFKLPTRVLIIWFIYELFFNQMILSTMFNKYLFYFIIYNTWHIISDFHWNNLFDINEMLVNIYNRSFSIKYVNIPDDWQILINEYVNNGLYRNADQSMKSTNSFDLNLGFNRLLIIQEKHTFYTTDGKTYTNARNEYFVENETVDSKDILPTNMKKYKL
jgi:hypothetical protein